MTCIAAVTDGKTVWIGGDAAGVDASDLTISIRADPKVYVGESNGIHWGFGFTSSFRMGQLIRYHLTLPPITKADEDDLFGYMVTKFIPIIRQLLSEGGVATSENGVETCGSFIFGLMGKIFHIDTDFQVGSASEPFFAVGSGGPFALGALKVLNRFREAGQLDPRTQVLEALTASECFSAGVRHPFTIVEIPYSTRIIPAKASKAARKKP